MWQRAITTLGLKKDYDSQERTEIEESFLVLICLLFPASLIPDLSGYSMEEKADLDAEMLARALIA